MEGRLRCLGNGEDVSGGVRDVGMKEGDNDVILQLGRDKDTDNGLEVRVMEQFGEDD